MTLQCYLSDCHGWYPSQANCANFISETVITVEVMTLRLGVIITSPKTDLPWLVSALSVESWWLSFPDGKCQVCVCMHVVFSVKDVTADGLTSALY